MITGAHAIIYSRDAEADRAFLRDVLEFPSVDAGGGWLIFALPPAEVAVHPADRNGRHELYLTCDDVDALSRSLRARRIPCSRVREERWGLLVEVTLPGGGRLGIYEPRHLQPPPARGRRPRARRRRPAGRRGRQASAPRRSSVDR